MVRSEAEVMASVMAFIEVLKARIPLLSKLARLFKNSRRKTVCPFRLRHMARYIPLRACE